MHGLGLDGKSFLILIRKAKSTSCCYKPRQYETSDSEPPPEQSMSSSRFGPPGRPIRFCASVSRFTVKLHASRQIITWWSPSAFKTRALARIHAADGCAHSVLFAMQLRLALGLSGLALTKTTYLERQSAKFPPLQRALQHTRAKRDVKTWSWVCVRACAIRGAE